MKVLTRNPSGGATNSRVATQNLGTCSAETMGRMRKLCGASQTAKEFEQDIGVISKNIHVTRQNTLVARRNLDVVSQHFRVVSCNLRVNTENLQVA